MMMARLLQLQYPDLNIPYVFANTGQEHERTLEFVQECAEHWAMPIVWVEAVVHHGERIASSHRIVNFDTAARSGEPFEEVITKYGIASKKYPHCTRELKINPMRSYIKTLGGQHTLAAVGMRIDEPKRLSDDPKIWYPMAEWGHTKQSVLQWWSEQPFDLGLEEREGNCLWCWQKSDKKQAENYAEHPEWYDFPRRMEANHAGVKAPDKPRTFFRGGRSTVELIRDIQP